MRPYLQERLAMLLQREGTQKIWIPLLRNQKVQSCFSGIRMIGDRNRILIKDEFFAICLYRNRVSVRVGDSDFCHFDLELK